MHSRYTARIGLSTIAILLLLSSWACAQAHYSVVATSSDVYVTSTDSASSPTNIYHNGAASLSGVARSGQWVYVTDYASDAVYAISAPTHNGNYSSPVVKTISLSGSASVHQPTAIQVDSSGGLYVIGQDNYAYVTGAANGWATPTVQVNSFAGSGLAGLALYGTNNAIVSHLMSGRGTQVSSLTTSGTTKGPDAIAGSSNPGSIATISDLAAGPLAYVLGGWSSTNGSGKPIGSLDVINAESHVVVKHYDFSSPFEPRDVTTYVRNGVHYLGIVGASTTGPGTYGNTYAWETAVGDDGLLASLTLPGSAVWGGATGSMQRIVVSEDGQIVWVTDPDGKSVRAWSTASPWGAPLSGGNPGGITLGGAPVAIANYTDAPFVPEPSSLMTLLSLIGGAATFRRRKS